MKKPIKTEKTKLPVSVFIICKNEEDRISNAIKSVIDWADEVILVDSGSTDDTIKIAKKLKVTKIVYNTWNGYGAQKSFAESLCKNNWILNIDADESVSDSLKNELFELFRKTPKHSAYYITVKITSRFSNKTPQFGPEDVVIRLYDKTKAQYDKHPIHDSVIIKSGTKGKLKGVILHNCFRSYSHALEKINMYTSMQAEDFMKKNRYPSCIRIVFEPFNAFIKSYFINKYIFLGLEGFIESVIYSFARTIRLAKARELFLSKQNK